MASDCALCAVDLKRSRVVPVPLHLRSGRVGREEKKEDACNSILDVERGKAVPENFPINNMGERRTQSGGTRAGRRRTTRNNEGTAQSKN